MELIVKFLMYLLENQGIWAMLGFLIVVSLPLALVGFIIFSWSASGKAVDERIARKLEIEKETHRNSSKLRKKFSEDVLILLQNIAEETCSDRAIVFEYSNGSANLGGLPFIFVSAAAEVVTPGTSPVSLQYQRINTALISRFLTDLEKEGYIFIEHLIDIKEKYPIIYGLMAPNGVNSALFYAIHGIDDVVGFIVATSTEDRILCKKDSLHEVAKVAQIISSMWNFEELDKKQTKKGRFKWPW